MLSVTLSNECSNFNLTFFSWKDSLRSQYKLDNTICRYRITFLYTIKLVAEGLFSKNKYFQVVYAAELHSPRACERHQKHIEFSHERVNPNANGAFHCKYLGNVHLVFLYEPNICAYLECLLSENPTRVTTLRQ